MSIIKTGKINLKVISESSESGSGQKQITSKYVEFMKKVKGQITNTLFLE